VTFQYLILLTIYATKISTLTGINPKIFGSLPIIGLSWFAGGIKINF
jgi:hypothetical protein